MNYSPSGKKTAKKLWRRLTGHVTKSDLRAIQHSSAECAGPSQEVNQSHSATHKPSDISCDCNLSHIYVPADQLRKLHDTCVSLREALVSFKVEGVPVESHTGEMVIQDEPISEMF